MPATHARDKQKNTILYPACMLSNVIFSPLMLHLSLEFVFLERQLI